MILFYSFNLLSVVQLQLNSANFTVAIKLKLIQASVETYGFNINEFLKPDC